MTFDWAADRMFERFTERARQVVVLAQDEARLMGHAWIGVEHLLLGLLREREGLGALALAEAGVSYEAARDHLLRTVATGPVKTTGQMPFTPRAKRTLERSLQESARLRHNFIGTEHVLLGLLHVSDTGAAAAVLYDLETSPRKVAAVLLRQLGAEDAAYVDSFAEFADRPPPTGTRDDSVDFDAHAPHVAVLRAEPPTREYAAPILPARDLHETLAFYSPLGFAAIGAPIETYQYLMVRRGTIELHFFHAPEIDPLTTDATCYLHVDDADALHADWARLGLSNEAGAGSCLMPIQDTEYGMREFALVDPSGNLLRVGSATRHTA